MTSGTSSIFEINIKNIIADSIKIRSPGGGTLYMNHMVAKNADISSF